MQELSAVFGQVQELLSTGISIIPVRDKADDPTKTNNPKGAKVAYTGWKKYQSEIIKKDELWHEMQRFDTTAIAMICGSVSGNLEIIDIDCKHWGGIDARIFSDIKQIYPDLWQRLRVHKTPSGGYHILYRIADGKAGKNEKLAWKADHKECGIETRGEGGYALAPPSMGYSIHSGQAIPLITEVERNSLINLCRGYNEKIVQAPTPKASKYESSYYDENPFDHFNGSAAGSDVLTEFGYNLFNDHQTYKRWTRPNRPESGVSVTFRKDYRLYYFFTTSTEFESGKWYSPATVLAILKFNGDKKKLHAYLVQEGYGRISAAKEKQIAAQSATYKTPVPNNLSDEAKQWVDEALQKATEMHHYGIFWAQGEKGNTYISRERLYAVSEQMGYRLHEDNVFIITGYKICSVTARKYFDAIRSYIRIEDAEEYENVFNAADEFLQKNGKHIISTLPILETTKIIASTKNISYKFYKNCYVEVNKEGLLILEYSTLTEQLVWETDIKPRDFSIVAPDVAKQSMMYRYIDLAIGMKPHVMQSIGYLIHDFKDATDAYIIGLVETCENPKEGGGSGKNIFSSLLQHMSSWHFVAGSQVRMDNQFMQSWNGERIMALSDLPKKFDFNYLKPISDGKGVHKKLFRDEKVIPIHLMPKLLFSTNFSYEVSDGGLKRRIRPIEFTDFFTRHGGVDKYFGKMFPDDWDLAEWAAYDNIMLSAIQEYMKDTKLKAADLSDTGWSKQYEQQFGALTHQFIMQNISDWQLLGKVKNDLFNQQYTDFCKDNSIPMKFHLSSQLMNSALTSFCEKNKIEFEKNTVIKENTITIRCRTFGKNEQKEPDLPF